VRYYFFCILLFFGFHVKAEKIPLSTYYIPGLIDSADQGVMIDMLRKIESYAELRFDVSLMPTKRVQLSFSHHKISGYFPELEEFRDPNSCRSAAFMQKGIIAITRIDDQLITDITQLHGRKVGIVAGYSYGKNITENPNIEISWAKNDDINIKKLLSGRVSAIVGDMHSTVSALKAAKMEKSVRFDAKNPISLLDVFFVFNNDEQGNQHCKKVSTAIEKLRQQGDLLNWFGYQ